MASPRVCFATTDGRLVPAVSVEEMREIDRIAVEETGPDLLQMMEHAGLELARAALAMLGEHWPAARVVVLAGNGGNGGGGLCAARLLASRGVDVLAVTIARPETVNGAVGAQLRMLHEAPAHVIAWSDAFDIGEADLVIDAVVGYGLHDAPRGPVMALIRAAQAAFAPVLSLDVPSGVDADSGETPGFAVQAARTLTLALPKRGLRREQAGDLWLADIGIPPGVFARAGVAFDTRFGPHFGPATQIRLRYPGEEGG